MDQGALRRQLADHLRVMADLGVTGISRDASWRTRQSAAGPRADVESMTAASAPVQASEPERPAPASPAEESSPLATLTTLGALQGHIGDCTRCILHTQGRQHVVFGTGNPHAELMFVGEAPGADEDRQGEPFVGRAGQLLTKIIEAIDLRREDVYIANVIKCRPPGNRNPEPVEVATCSPFLLRQIDLVQPRVMVALGTFAAHTLLGTTAPISRLRGRVHEFRGGIKLIPTFHPAYLLRSPERKREVWEDMKIVRGLLAESG